MKKPQIKPSVSEDTEARFKAIADRYDMTTASLAALLITEFSHVRKEAFFHALAAIPEDLKTRPVGRPPGSRKEEKPHLQATA
jgi:hypothetical protein